MHKPSWRTAFPSQICGLHSCINIIYILGFPYSTLAARHGTFAAIRYSSPPPHPSARHRPTQATRAPPSLPPPPPRRSPRAHSLTVVLADSPAQIRLRERLPRQGCGRAAVLGHQVQHVPAVTKPCGWAKWTSLARNGAATARRKTSCPHTCASRAPAPDRSAAGASRARPGWGVGGGGQVGQPALLRMALFDARNALTLSHAQGRERRRRRRVARRRL